MTVLAADLKWWNGALGRRSLKTCCLIKIRECFSSVLWFWNRIQVWDMLEMFSKHNTHTQMKMQRTFPPPLRCDITMTVSLSRRGAGKCEVLCCANTLALFQNPASCLAFYSIQYIDKWKCTSYAAWKAKLVHPL